MEKKLSSSESEELLKIVKNRFEKHTHRHEGIEWNKVSANQIGSKS